MKCPNCAAETDSRKRFCDFCGSELPRPKKSGPSQHNYSQNQTVINYYGAAPPQPQQQNLFSEQERQEYEEYKAIKRMQMEAERRRQDAIRWEQMKANYERLKKRRRRLLIAFIFFLLATISGFSSSTSEDIGVFLIVLLITVALGYFWWKTHQQMKQIKR